MSYHLNEQHQRRTSIDAARPLWWRDAAHLQPTLDGSKWWRLVVYISHTQKPPLFCSFPLSLALFFYSVVALIYIRDWRPSRKFETAAVFSCCRRPTDFLLRGGYDDSTRRFTLPCNMTSTNTPLMCISNRVAACHLINKTAKKTVFLSPIGKIWNEKEYLFDGKINMAILNQQPNWFRNGPSYQSSDKLLTRTYFLHQYRPRWFDAKRITRGKKDLLFTGKGDVVWWRQYLQVNSTEKKTGSYKRNRHDAGNEATMG